MNRSTIRTPVERRWLKVLGTLNEYQARLFVADKALDQGRGGVTRLSELSGMSRMTITKAVAELIVPASGQNLAAGAKVRFEWSSGTGVDEYWLTIGTAINATDLYLKTT